MKGSNIESRTYADINMTPLIDVMLVLLVIFIITIPMQTHAIKIDNPQGDSRHDVPPTPIDLSIDFDGTIAWNSTRIDRATLRDYISHESVKPVQPEVRLTVDRFARYETVAETLADLQRLGLKKIGFVNPGAS